MATININMISYTLKRTVDLKVIIPTVTIPMSMGMGAAPEELKYVGKPKFPVLYLHHGGGNNQAQWTGYTNVELFAEERNIVVVMAATENKAFVNVGGDKFYDFLENELQDFIKGTFPVSDRVEDTYVAGLSMGGYGALNHALRNPDKYCAMGGFSAAVDINPYSVGTGPDEEDPAADELLKHPELDNIALAKQLISDGKKFPKMYLAIGENDFLFDRNVKFRDMLLNAGVDVTWEQLPVYGHEWRFWDIQIEKFLDWLPRTDAYADKGRRQI